MNKKALTFNVIFIAAALIVALIAVTAALLGREEGAFAVVSVDGEVIAEYPLSEDGEFVLRGGSNILVIEDGTVYMRSADCPDKTCVNVGRIRYAGESITCLPNKINVYIRGVGGVDVVS